MPALFPLSEIKLLRQAAHPTLFFWHLPQAPATAVGGRHWQLRRSDTGCPGGWPGSEIPPMSSGVWGWPCTLWSGFFLLLLPPRFDRIVPAQPFPQWLLTVKAGCYTHRTEAALCPPIPFFPVPSNGRPPSSGHPCLPRPSVGTASRLASPPPRA